eukprot:20704-Heterococcus_DN1.PRE.2
MPSASTRSRVQEYQLHRSTGVQPLPGTAMRKSSIYASKTKLRSLCEQQQLAYSTPCALLTYDYSFYQSHHSKSSSLHDSDCEGL